MSVVILTLIVLYIARPAGVRTESRSYRPNVNARLTSGPPSSSPPARLRFP